MKGQFTSEIPIRKNRELIYKTASSSNIVCLQF